MDFRPLLARGERPLPSERNQQEWTEAAATTGLSPYVCKASYVCGVMRELMASSGLNFAGRYHLGALFLALDATELLGRCVKGSGDDKTTEQLRDGLRYLEALTDPTVPPLRHTVEQYRQLRNFTGHGAASPKQGLYFDPNSTATLLNRLACALNQMWDDDAVSPNFARAKVLPLIAVSNGQQSPIYVADVQLLLKRGTRPGDSIDHEDVWRRRVVHLDTSSPAVTGRGEPASR